MAKLERRIRGDFDQVLEALDRGIIDGSISASYEDGSDCSVGPMRCAVRVYERYSYLGGNRVSLSVTLFACGNDVRLTAISSGGSQAVFIKINTWGEDAFLDTIRDTVEQFT